MAFLELLLSITDSYKLPCHIHACEVIKLKDLIQWMKIGLQDENVATHLHLLKP